MFNETRDLVADLIASTAQWQTITGTANEAAAKAFVFQVSRTPDADGDDDDAVADTYSRPYAMVWTADEVNVGRGGYSNGALTIAFELAYAEAVTDKAALDDFEAKVGTVLKQMMQNSEAGGRVVLRRITLAAGPGRTRRENDEGYVNAMYRVETGLERLP